MAKDKTQGMQRIDLRIPDHIYSEIERIAIYNNLPYSPTTKPNTDGSLKKDKNGKVIQPKVSVSPIILDLINLGLKAIASGGENPDKLGDKNRHIEYQVNNQIDVTEIEKKIINTLSQQIEGILSEKILATFKTSPEIRDIFETLVANKVKESVQISENNPEIIPDTDTQESIDEVENKLPSNKEQIVTAESDINEVEISEINQNEAIITDNQALVSDSLYLELSDNQEFEVKPFDEAVIEIKRLKEQGLGNTAIAKKLTGKYLNKSGTGTNWGDTQVRRILTK